MRCPALLCVVAAPLLSVALGVAAAQDAPAKEKPRFFFEGGKTPAAPGEVAPATPAAPAAMPGEPALTFEDAADLAACQALDAEAVIDLDTTEGAADTGRGCLRMTYVAREGAFEQLSAQPLTVAAASTLSFAIRTDLPTNLSFGVVEDDGAFYQQFAALPAGKWTHVRVPLTSLVLSQDTQDPSGRLEPDRITEIRLADLANLPGGLGDALGRKTGVQRLCLDDVALSAAAETEVAGAGDPRLFVDGFEREAIHALGIGGALLTLLPDAEGHALSALLQDRASRWAGLVMAVGQLDLSQAGALALRLRASEPLVVNVTLEERDGSKYSQRVGLEQADAWIEKVIPLDALLLETDSEDENGRLDRDQLRVLVLVADVARAVRLPVALAVDDVAFR